MSIADEIGARLTKSFAPRLLEIDDESENHRGHAGYREGGESHFRVHIASDAFQGMNRVARERAVQKALGAELIGRIHALSLKIEA